MYILYNRRRIKTEEKAKVATAVWGAESIYFLAALAILYQDDLKNRMNCTRDDIQHRIHSSLSSIHPGAK